MPTPRESLWSSYLFPSTGHRLPYHPDLDLGYSDGACLPPLPGKQGFDSSTESLSLGGMAIPLREGGEAGPKPRVQRPKRRLKSLAMSSRLSTNHPVWHLPPPLPAPDKDPGSRVTRLTLPRCLRVNPVSCSLPTPASSDPSSTAVSTATAHPSLGCPLLTWWGEVGPKGLGLLPPHPQYPQQM